jgi:hypothetical protein
VSDYDVLEIGGLAEWREHYGGFRPNSSRDGRRIVDHDLTMQYIGMTANALEPSVKVFGARGAASPTVQNNCGGCASARAATSCRTSLTMASATTIVPHPGDGPSQRSARLGGVCSSGKSVNK